MTNIKNSIRKFINNCGIEIYRIQKEKPVQPDAVEGDLGLYKNALGNFYLPLNVTNDIIVNHIKNGRVFEPEVIEIAKKYIKKGTAVLDIGANFGQMSLNFSKLTGNDGTVYSFEAQKRVFEILEKNAAANKATNIKPYFNAVYFESNKTFHFPEPDFVQFGAYGSYNLPLNETAGNPVTSLKIDDLGITKPISFMKVDVQGCDLFAMQGAAETIKKHKMPILFEFEQQFQETYGTTFQDYVEFIDSVGYKFTEVIMDINYLVEPK